MGGKGPCPRGCLNCRAPGQDTGVDRVRSPSLGDPWILEMRVEVRQGSTHLLSQHLGG